MEEQKDNSEELKPQDLENVSGGLSAPLPAEPVSRPKKAEPVNT